MNENKIQEHLSGYLVLDKDGLNDGKESFNSFLPKILFETALIRGATVFSLLSLARTHKDFFISISNGSNAEVLFDYLDYIDWEKNSGLFYKKFGKEHKEQYTDKYVLVETEEFYDKLDVYYLKNELSVFLANGVDVNKKSLFGERLENILDLPVKYKGLIEKPDGDIFIPMQIGKLFIALLTLVLSLCEGSSIVEDEIKYLS